MNNKLKNNIDIDSSIAIIGMACRLPGANNIEEFWNNLINGVESVRESTEEELLGAYIPESILQDPNFKSASGRLDGIESFDATFFDLTKRIAEITSPQQRLLFEMSQHALENAGYYAEGYDGTIGINCAIESSDYEFEHIQGSPELYETLGHKTIQFSNDVPFSATQVAYKLNLTGPALNITTACSSSMVAIHSACKTLLDYEADIMLAGGASYSVNQHKGYLYQDGGIGAKDGHCRAFDINASGTVSGNGAGMVVLKRLQDAIDDGDHIYSVILSTAANNDGNDKVSYSAPSVQGQTDVIADAHQFAGINADQVTYVEAHGTGTSLGDPIEVAALTDAYRETSDKENFCALGALKSNIGHLSCAAGVAGTIKASLSLFHKQIPPTLNITKPNPKLNIEKSPFYLNTELKEWDIPEYTNSRIAGVSSFGMGGTNVHAIVSEWENQIKSPSSKYECIIPISAKSTKALSNNISALKHYFENQPKSSMEDIAYTLQVGRKPLPFRTAISVKNFESASAALGVLEKQIFDIPASNKDLILMFPGQGTQYNEMAKSLYEQESTFKNIFDQCSKELLDKYQIDLKKLLLEGSNSLLDQTSYTQVALFAVEYSLAMTLNTYGVKATAMIGHSVGEYVAATIAGVFSLSDALMLIVNRGQLMQEMQPGVMVAVYLSEVEIEKIMPSSIDIAAINQNNQTVISGPEDLVLSFTGSLEAKGIRFKPLNTSHAFHSSMMDPCLESYRAVLSTVQFNKPKIPFISNLSGKWVDENDVVTPEYWLSHLRNTVRFYDGIQTLHNEMDAIFLEVGPGTSCRSVFSTDKNLLATHVFSCMSNLRNPKSDIQQFKQTLADIWANGTNIDWIPVQQQESRKRVPLPGYAFDRQFYWIEKKYPSMDSLKQRNIVPQKSDSIFYTPAWKQHPIARLNASNTESDSYWIIASDNDKQFSGLKEELLKNNTQVIRLENGNQFSQVDSEHYIINPHKEEDFDLFIQHLNGKNLSTIIYCTPAIALENDSIVSDTFISDIDLNINKSFYHMLSLQKAIDLKYNSKIQFVCLGNDGISITGQEDINPFNAMSSALCKTIQREYQNFNCSYLDIAPADDKNDIQCYAEQVINECNSGLKDDQVAFRRHHRYVPDYSNINLPDEAPLNSKLRKGGVYVITGGLNGIGFEVAKFLASKHQGKLVLLSRTAPTYPQELITQDKAKNCKNLLNKITELEQLGADVISLPVDVGSREELHLSLNLAADRFGDINGVIHAAGIAGGGLLATRSHQDFEKTFSAKIQGSVFLLEYFEKKKADFIFLFSSQNALKSSLARGDYSAANAFMDSLTERVAHKGTIQLTSINWCAWKDAGMLYDSVKKYGNELSPEKIAECLSTEEGLNIFEKLATSHLERVIISKGLLSESLKDEEPLVEVKKDVRKNVTAARPINMTTEYLKAETEAATSIEDIWSYAIGVQPIGINDNFFELGGDSLIAAQVVLQLQKQFNVDLALRDFLVNPTIHELEECILSKKTNVHDVDLLASLLEDVENTEKVE